MRLVRIILNIIVSTADQATLFNIYCLPNWLALGSGKVDSSTNTKSCLHIPKGPDAATLLLGVARTLHKRHYSSEGLEHDLLGRRPSFVGAGATACISLPEFAFQQVASCAIYDGAWDRQDTMY